VLNKSTEHNSVLNRFGNKTSGKQGREIAKEKASPQEGVPETGLRVRLSALHPGITSGSPPAMKQEVAELDPALQPCLKSPPLARAHWRRQKARCGQSPATLWVLSLNTFFFFCEKLRVDH